MDDEMMALGQRMAASMNEALSDRTLQIDIKDTVIKIYPMPGYAFWFFKNPDGSWYYDGWDMDVRAVSGEGAT